jgi:hypothetical protein
MSIANRPRHIKQNKKQQEPGFKKFCILITFCRDRQLIVPNINDGRQKKVRCNANKIYIKMGWLDNLRTKGLNHGQKLYVFAADCPDYLKINYRELKDAGELESIIFSSIFVLRIYKNKYPEKYDESRRGLYATLYNKHKEILKKDSSDDFLTFLNSRINFYSNECDNFNGVGYLPSKLYSTFYIAPLISEPENTSDLGEIMKFHVALIISLKKIRESVTSL